MSTLQSALDALSKAHGPAALRDAFRTVQRRVRAARADDGDARSLGRIIMEAIVYRERLKTEGVSQHDLDAGLESVVRDAWPKAKDRTEPWRYICETCGDTGFQMIQCTPRFRCDGLSSRVDSPGDKPGKYKRMCVGSTTYEHEYGVACRCAKGDTFRPRARNQDADSFEAVAKGRSKQPTKWGR